MRDSGTGVVGYPSSTSVSEPARPISEVELENVLASEGWTEVDIELACRRLLDERNLR